MSSVRLSKLEATGNDFLVWSGLDARTGTEELLSARAARMCDRRRGIGADGLILLLPASEQDSDCRMILVNADGEVAEMSGNGIRCLAWVAHRAGCGTDERLVVDTGAGRRVVELRLDIAGDVASATVDMGPVTIDDLERTIQVDGGRYVGAVADIGNPHYVLFVDEPATAAVATHGPILEHDPSFPNRTNVEFATVSAPDVITMRVWERGVGETLSCGTGASATAAVAHRGHRVGPSVTVRVPGGDLVVEVGDTVRLGGPVRHVFDADVELDGFTGDTA
jgi:diaminopimelate epimerase